MGKKSRKLVPSERDLCHIIPIMAEVAESAGIFEDSVTIFLQMRSQRYVAVYRPIPQLFMQDKLQHFIFYLNLEQFDINSLEFQLEFLSNVPLTPSSCNFQITKNLKITKIVDVIPQLYLTYLVVFCMLSIGWISLMQ